MFRLATFVALQVALLSVAFVPLGQLSTVLQTKPRPCLNEQVAAVKEDKAKALDMFSKGEGGFKDRDLYVWCADSDGIVTATPYWNKGKGERH